MSLTADRSTQWRPSDFVAFGVAASTKIYTGQMVGLNASGYLVPMSATTGLTPVGAAFPMNPTNPVDNTTGANGALQCNVRAGQNKWNNSLVNTATVANIGSLVYAEDDQTVGTSATGNSPAGICRGIDTDGVWVEVFKFPAAVASLLTANNLSDVANAETSLDNLTSGLGIVVDATSKIDTAAANALALGPTTATAVNIGAAAIPTAALGAFSAVGAATFRSLLQTKTATYTVQTPAIDGDSNIQDSTDGAAITLPATSAANKGMVITLQNTAAAGLAGVQFTANAADGIVGTIGAVTFNKAAGAATLVNTKATAKKGDYAMLQSDGAGNWWVVGGVGTWA